MRSIRAHSYHLARRLALCTLALCIVAGLALIIAGAVLSSFPAVVVGSALTVAAALPLGAVLEGEA